jgi:hypothetical protein
MADTPLGSRRENPVRPARGSPPGMPRWVKLFGLISGIVLLVLFVVLHLSGLGGMAGHRH